MLAKQQAREQARAYLRQLTEPQKSLYSLQICRQLQQQLQDSTLRHIGLYSPLPDEPQLQPLLAGLQELGLQCYLPRCLPGKALVWHHAAAKLHSGSYGILEPQADSPTIPAQQLQLLVIPALAYNAKLQRLGRGAGYYDRLIPALSPQCQLWGVVFSAAQIMEFAAEPHDLQLQRLFYAQP